MLRQKTRVLTIIVVLTNVIGNFLLSSGMKQHGSALGFSAGEYLGVLFNPWVSAGVLLLILWLLSRMALLSWADLSYVVPVTAIGYVLNAVMGSVFLNEQVSPVRWAGTLLIAAGIILVSSTSIRTTTDSSGEERP
jgi:uncharacterized membrane protein